MMEPLSPRRNRSAGKARAAFYLRTTPIARAARIICRSTQALRKAARHPERAVKMKVIKAETKAKIAGMGSMEIRRLNALSVRKRPPWDSVVEKLGRKELEKQEWLIPTPLDNRPQIEKELFPRPPKREDGSYIYDRVPEYPLAPKRSRNISDLPADYGQPACKMRTMSPLQATLRASADLNGVDEADVTSLHSPSEEEEDGERGGSRSRRRAEFCANCYSDKKGALLRCRDCRRSVHPSCLGYSEKLAKRILSATFWQCVNCKTCSICNEADPVKDDLMLFCDSCDLGYHMDCHRPPVTSMPLGEWICCRCQNDKTSTRSAISYGSAVTGTTVDPVLHSAATELAKIQQHTSAHFSFNNNNYNMNNNNHDEIIPSEAWLRFLPLLPPHLQLSTGLLPPNWEDCPVDPTIPDVSNWEPKAVVEHFMGQGIRPEHAEIFRKEEIDGSSLLLLQRQDVVAGLGLKMGPALKVFEQVRKLQTRRHLPATAAAPTLSRSS